jgi:NTP pyrophosphatase (non-canonical NTP hydrolase)
MSIQKIFKAVEQERDRQDAKWGDQLHDISNWHLILSEEMGEVSKETNEVVFRDAVPDYLREELVQVIAVATRMIERIDSLEDK